MITRRTRIFFALLIISFSFVLTGCDGLFADLSDLDEPSELDEPPGDTGTDDTDVDCVSETHAEFCERLGHECGPVTDIDNCGDARTVDCDDHEEFGCGREGSCLLADNIGSLEANSCECPDVDFNADAESICEDLEAECADIAPVELCGYPWRVHGEIDCGECLGDVECGLAEPNVCGCPSDETFCEDECVDTDDDPDHCGECDRQCAEGESCEEGKCACTLEDYVECEDECVDTTTNSDHCGGCNSPCGEGMFCVDGECEIDCPSDTTACDDVCIDTDNNPNHCGECDNPCEDDVEAASPVCIEGSCSYECDDPEDTFCESVERCIDTDVDVDHCGGCDNPCDDGEVCVGGECGDGECSDHEDCEDNLVCDATGKCVTCLNDDHCNDNGFCTEDNECVCQPHVYTASRDGTARKLDSAGEEVWDFATEEGDSVSIIAVDSEGNIYTGSHDNKARKFYADGGEPLSIEHDDPVRGIAVDSEGNIYTGAGDMVRKFDSEGTALRSIMHEVGVRDIAVDGEGNVYTAAGHTVRKFDSGFDSESTAVWTFDDHTDQVGRIVVDGDGNVYSASRDETARKIDSEGEQVWKYEGHSEWVFAIAVDGDGNAYTGSEDGTVHRVDSDGDQYVWEFDDHTDTVDSITVDGEGNVYSAAWDNTARKIDPSGEEVWKFEDHDDWLWGIAVDPGLYATYDDTCQPVVD